MRRLLIVLLMALVFFSTVSVSWRSFGNVFRGFSLSQEFSPMEDFTDYLENGLKWWDEETD
ncbi:hypothetical protein [Negadavirga shengliensis]|uniref:Uncharacterized protein n=1 Tax=Negadavirga shengliensis TaxID=1389218 RepID=A0ABV9T3P2_9BACT